MGSLTWWDLEIISQTYDFRELEISVAPNPAGAYATVEMEDLRTVLIYDLNGRLVALHNDLSGDSHQLDLAGLAANTYVLVAVNGERQATSHTLVKR